MVPPGSALVVEGTSIAVKGTMKYSKLMEVAFTSDRLLHNVASTSCRLLYTGVMCSTALYGAPIRENTLTAKGNFLLKCVCAAGQLQAGSWIVTT